MPKPFGPQAFLLLVPRPLPAEVAATLQLQMEATGQGWQSTVTKKSQGLYEILEWLLQLCTVCF